ncbi:MAG: nucleotidyltransferase family protein [Caldilineaceae bacterium]
MNTTEISNQLRSTLPLLRQQYHIKSLSLFGSYVRNEQRPDSDLDLLVTFQEEPTLLQFVELENKLSDILGVKVDLVMSDSLKPAIGAVILKEAIPV